MRLRTAAAIAACIAVIVGGIVGLNLSPHEPLLRSVEVSGAVAGAASVEGSWPMAAKPKHQTAFLVADAVVPLIQLYSAPNVPLLDPHVEIPKVGGTTMHNPTWEGLSVLFLVKGQKPGWYNVEVSARPNGLEAWVKASDVAIRTVPNWIQIHLGTRQAQLMHGDTVLFQTTVAVGSPSAPTPTGGYFVDGTVHLANPNGAYGIAQMSVSAFSDIYEAFGVGVGQIALHGTNEPGLLGQAVSHGCVRFSNDALQHFLDGAPNGTPVEIDP